MIRPIPHARFVMVAIGAATMLAFLLNLRLHDWVASLHLAVVLTFEIITLALVMNALVRAIIRWLRRKPDDPDDTGRQKDYGLAG